MSVVRSLAHPGSPTRVVQRVGVAWRSGIDLGAAREKVRVARALADLPRLSAAMERGELSYSKVRALTRVATPANEAQLLDVAQCGTAAHVETLVRAWRRVDRTVAARDARCRFPGCTARHTDAHHLEHWADGGATRLDNLVLLWRQRLTRRAAFRPTSQPSATYSALRSAETGRGDAARREMHRQTARTGCPPAWWCDPDSRAPSWPCAVAFAS